MRLCYLNLLSTMQLSKNIKTVEGLTLRVEDFLISQLSTLNRLIIGGGERVRTDDPLRARQVLSQLSYTPVKSITDYELRIGNRIQKPIRNS